jgi:hypothetical protein
MGDSIMEQFVKPIYLRIQNIGRPLNTTTLPEWKDVIRQRLRSKMVALEERSDDYPTTTATSPSSSTNNNNNNDTTIVLLLSSHAWDLLEKDNIGGFSDHESALRGL